MPLIDNDNRGRRVVRIGRVLAVTGAVLACTTLALLAFALIFLR